MKQAPKVTARDLETVLDKTEVIREKFERAGPLGKFIKENGIIKGRSAK